MSGRAPASLYTPGNHVILRVAGFEAHPQFVGVGSFPDKKLRIVSV